MEILGFSNYKIYPNGDIFNKHNRLMSFFLTNGYKTVCLYKANKKYNKKVHKLVAENYLKAKLTDIIDHKNRDKIDNRVENLRIVSNCENSHNIDQKSTKSNTGYTGIYYKNKKLISTITINYIEHKRLFENDDFAIQKALHFRLMKKIENGILI